MILKSKSKDKLDNLVEVKKTKHGRKNDVKEKPTPKQRGNKNKPIIKESLIKEKIPTGSRAVRNQTMKTEGSNVVELVELTPVFEICDSILKDDLQYSYVKKKKVQVPEQEAHTTSLFDYDENSIKESLEKITETQQNTASDLDDILAKLESNDEPVKEEPIKEELPEKEETSPFLDEVPEEETDNYLENMLEQEEKAPVFVDEKSFTLDDLDFKEEIPPEESNPFASRIKSTRDNSILNLDVESEEAGVNIHIVKEFDHERKEK